MLWLWYLTLFAALCAFLHRRSHPHSMPYVMATLALIQVGFLILVLFLSSPFTLIFPPPPDGRDLNPLLQDPGLAFHPPTLYMGYVGFSVPFAFAIAALLTGRTGNEWVVATRRWTLVAWIALTTGILWGGYWAYYELGWGGYWGWDPVENASLMPWLTGTAFLHSVMAQERRDLFKAWNVFLVIATFALSLLGTFLVRSGVLTSVHAFASDPDRGLVILLFLGVVLVGSFGLFLARIDRLRSVARVEALLSRESTLLYNNLFLVVATLTVLAGTLYPLVIEVFSGSRVTVAAPYFNKVFPPLFLAVILLMAAGPVVPWRRCTGRRIRRHFLVPLAITGGGLLITLLLGVRHPYALAALAIIYMALVTTLGDMARAAATRARAARTNWLTGFWQLVRQNRRRHGGLLVHLGVVVIALGLLGSGVFQDARTIVLEPSDRFELGNFSLAYRGVRDIEGPNYVGREARFALSRDGRPVAELRPQRRMYPRGQMTTTEAAIRSSLTEDIYLVMGEELEDGRLSVQAYLNPLVSWIWIGWGIMGVGAFLALSQGRLWRRRVATP
jgi:cytochrome c-type biogenesis protein CcmF